MSNNARKLAEWWRQYEETATRLHEAGNFRAADDIRTLVDGLKQHEVERDIAREQHANTLNRLLETRSERDNYRQERDHIRKQRDEWKAERDRLAKERDEALGAAECSAETEGAYFARMQTAEADLDRLARAVEHEGERLGCIGDTVFYTLANIAARAAERDLLAEVLKWYAVDTRIGYKAREALASLANPDGEA